MKVRLLLPLSFAALVACSDTTGETPAPIEDAGSSDVTNPLPDSGLDAGADMEMVDPNNPGLALTPQQEGLSADGNADVDSALTNEARAGRIEGETGFHGLWAHCREGDFRLYNDAIELCIQNETTNRLEMFTGGGIVDARVYGSDGEDVFDLFKPRFGFNVHFAESVRVVRDGSQGGPAVIRVEGRDTPVAYLVGVSGGLFDSNGLKLTTEYRLWPGARDVEIVTWVDNPLEFNKGGVVGEWFAPGDRSRQFRAGHGLVKQDLRPFEWLATLGEDTSFGWMTDKDATIDELPFTASSPWLLINTGAESVPSKGSLVWRRWLAVGDGSVESIREIQAARMEADLGPAHTLTVEDSAGNQIKSRLVEIWDAEIAVTAGYTSDDGTFTFRAPAKSYTVKVAAPMGGEAQEESVSFDGAGKVTIPEPAYLTVNVSEGQTPRTALVRVRGDADDEFFAVSGVGRAELAPGTYTLAVSRGMEYDVVVREITVSAGQTLVEDVAMTRSVDTSGWIAADFHQHMEPSSDSDIDVRSRIIDNVAEGMEFVASTDHDVVTDLQPWIDELGLQDELSTFPGAEISPGVGHLGLYPMVHDTTKRGNGAVMLATIDDDGESVAPLIPELIAQARQLPSNPVVQLNHPRGGTSLFELADYEPTMDPNDVMHKHWTTDFDVIEIVNRVDASCDIMADWSTFLNTGHRLTGLGNSDAHGMKRGDAPGMPRNYLHIDAEPGSITPEQVRTALLEGRVSVAAHAFLSFSDGKVPGDLLNANTTDPVDFGVRVQTPAFSQVTRLHVVVNGVVVESLDANPGGGFDVDQTIQRTFDKDSWIIFVAVGPRPNTPADYGIVTLAFSNPIFVDVDGDTNDDGDDFEAPGLGPVDLTPINETGWCD